MTPQAAPLQRSLSGFTLIGWMLVVAAVAILAMVALPGSAEFVQRGTRADS